MKATSHCSLQNFERLAIDQFADLPIVVLEFNHTHHFLFDHDVAGSEHILM